MVEATNTEKLYQITDETMVTVAHVEEMLEKYLGADWSSNEHWETLGGEGATPEALTGLSGGDPHSPLVERVINSMDAVIEYGLAKTGLEEKARANNWTPEQAVNAIKETLGPEFYPSMQIVDLPKVHKGKLLKNRVHTVWIADSGIGIKKDEFKETILSLARSQKRNKRYLVGQFGYGASMSYSLCPYTVILSRHMDEEDWYMTVVRKQPGHEGSNWNVFDDTEGSSYQHLKTPMGTQPLRWDGVERDHGTVVIHVGYKDLGRFANGQKVEGEASGIGPYRAHAKTVGAWGVHIPDPLIPWRLCIYPALDRNIKVTGAKPQTVDGLSSRMERLHDTVQENPDQESIAIEQDITIPAEFRLSDSQNPVGPGALVHVRAWFFTEKLNKVERGELKKGGQKSGGGSHFTIQDKNTWRGDTSTFVTTSGRTQEFTTMAEELRSHHFNLLADNNIVLIDIDSLPRRLTEGFFMTNRMQATEKGKEMLKEVKRILIEDNLAAISQINDAVMNREYGKRSDDTVSPSFGRLLSDLLNGDIDGPVEEQDADDVLADIRRKKEKEPELKKRPDYLKWAREDKPLRIHAGANDSSLDLLMNYDPSNQEGEDPTFRYTVVPDDKALEFGGATRPTSGRYTVRIFSDPEAPLRSYVVHATATKMKKGGREIDWEVRTDPDHPAIIEIVPDEDKFVGLDVPTKVEFGRERLVSTGKTELEIRTDGSDQAMNGPTVVKHVKLPTGWVLGGVRPPRFKNGKAKLVFDIPTTARKKYTVIFSIHDEAANPPWEFSRDHDIDVVPYEERSASTVTIKSQKFGVPNLEVSIKKVFSPSEIEKEGDLTWDDMLTQDGTLKKWDRKDVACGLLYGTSPRRLSVYINQSNYLWDRYRKEIIRTKQTRARTGLTVDQLSNYWKSACVAEVFRIELTKLRSKPFEAEGYPLWSMIIQGRMHFIMKELTEWKQEQGNE